MQYKVILSPKLGLLLSHIAEQPLNIKITAKLLDLIKKVKESREMFETLRMTLLKKHGELDESGNLTMSEDGKNYLVKDQEAFQKEYQELLDLEVELPKFSMTELSELKISVNDLTLLKPLITPKNAE